MSFKEIDVINQIASQEHFTVGDIIWGIYPAMIGASDAQIEFHKKQVFNMINSINYNLLLEAVKKSTDYDGFEVTSRLVKNIGILLIMIDKYDTFIDIIEKNDFSTAKFSSYDVVQLAVKGIVNFLKNNHTEFYKYKKNIPDSFIATQIKYQVDLYSMFIQTTNINTLVDLYNNIFTPFFKDVTFTEFVNNMNETNINRLILDEQSADLINQANAESYRISLRKLDSLKIKDIKSVLKINSNFYDITDIYISPETFTTATEEELNEYFSRINSIRRISIPKLVESGCLSDNLIKKHFGLFLQDSYFVSSMEKRFSLKQMLSLLEEECA